MSYKKIAACIYLENGKAITGFSDHKIIAESAVDLAVKYSNLGSDELVLFDLSDSELF